MAGRRGSRDEWQKRVERWGDSGLTAKQFAAETGINAGTLQFWKYKLKAGAGSSRRQRAKRVAVSSLVEVRPISVAVESRFEIELIDGRRLRVPAVFEPTALRALLAALEPAS
jgi:transposase-like protein